MTGTSETAAATGARSAQVPSRAAASSAGGRRELAAALGLGAVGAGLVLVALRQEWARVTVLAPRPLPASVVAVTGQDLIPVGTALAVAALASLAAVLATRRVPRRITGLFCVALGAWVAALAAVPISAAEALSAARRASLAAGSGSGAAAGSATAGGQRAVAGTAGQPSTGFPAHVLLAASGWRWLVIVGACAVVAAGLAVMLRANRLPVMSGRFDRPPRPHQAARTPAGLRGEPAAARGQAATRSAARSGQVSQPADSASMWDSLSAGADPTAGADQAQ
jgi:uncharacterized membrane protein (TIGR02234 family)